MFDGNRGENYLWRWVFALLPSSQVAKLSCGILPEHGNGELAPKVLFQLFKSGISGRFRDWTQCADLLARHRFKRLGPYRRHIRVRTHMGRHDHALEPGTFECKETPAGVHQPNAVRFGQAQQPIGLLFRLAQREQQMHHCVGRPKRVLQVWLHLCQKPLGSSHWVGHTKISGYP